MNTTNIRVKVLLGITKLKLEMILELIGMGRLKLYRDGGSQVISSKMDSSLTLKIAWNVRKSN